MKDSAEVVSEFGELVNMTAQELREWLKSEDSTSAGWAGDKTDGESVGHESGRKIIEILEANPGMEPGKYSEEHIQHMRKVVSYCKRHLAQEERSNNEKPVEEVEKTKSFASLKNWGHDCIKAREEKKKEKEKNKNENDKGPSGSEGKATAKGQKAGDKREAAVVIEDDDEEDKKGDEGAGKKKKRKTGEEEKEGEQVEVEDDIEEVEEEEEEEEEEEDEDEDFVGDEEEDENDEDEGEGEKKEKGGQKGGSKGKGPQKGQTVSWNWAGGQPEGKVLDVKGEETSIQTKRGNEVTRKGNPDDPAVVLDTGKSQALKLDHELND